MDTIQIESYMLFVEPLSAENQTNIKTKRHSDPHDRGAYNIVKKPIIDEGAHPKAHSSQHQMPQDTHFEPKFRQEDISRDTSEDREEARKAEREGALLGVDPQSLVQRFDVWLDWVGLDL